MSNSQATLDPNASTAPPRRSRRRHLGVVVRGGGEQILAVGLGDSGSGGLGVRLNAGLGVGRVVSLEVFLSGVARPVRLAGEVLQCSANADGTYEAGLRLCASYPGDRGSAAAGREEPAEVRDPTGPPVAMSAESPMPVN